MFNLFAVKDRRFLKKAIPMIILGTLMYYFFVALIGEQVNILTTVLPEKTSWNIGVVMNSYTIGGLISVPATFVINTILMKANTKRFLTVSILLVAAFIALMGYSVTAMSMVLFCAMFLLMRVFANCIQLGANYMCTEWWVKNRGKSLGFITMGAPIASASFVAIMTFLTGSKLEFTGSYYVFAIVLAVFAVAVALFYVNKPKDAGLYPDGDIVPPADEVQEIQKISILSYLKNPLTWAVVAAFGIINFANNSMTAFFVTSMVAREVPASVYLVTLSVGAIAGIPISYILGAVDDKLGTPKASLCLCGLSILGFLGMAFAAPNSWLAIGLACFGYASITGAFPNLQPSMISYVFGRTNFLGASRIIMSLSVVIGSFASQYMGVFLANGKLKEGYFGICGGILVSAILILLIGRAVKKQQAATN